MVKGAIWGLFCTFFVCSMSTAKGYNSDYYYGRIAHFYPQVKALIEKAPFFAQKVDAWGADYAVSDELELLVESLGEELKSVVFKVLNGHVDGERGEVFAFYYATMRAYYDQMHALYTVCYTYATPGYHEKKSIVSAGNVSTSDLSTEVSPQQSPTSSK